MSPKLLEKIASLDFDTLTKAVDNLSGLKGLNTKDLTKGIKDAIAYTTKSRFDGAGSFKTLTSTERALINVGQYAKTLGNVLGKEASLFAELQHLEPQKAVASLTATLKDIDFNKLNVNTSRMDTTRLKTRENALGALDSLLGNDAFIKLNEERSGVQDTRAKINRARGLKESAESRISNFGALMAQNTAFMGSYAVLGMAQQTIGSTLGFFSGFDDAMKNLQAITGDTTQGLEVMGQAV